MTMDIHARYRTAKYVDIVPRFNERFLLSFSDLTHFLSVDDELNVIPFTSNVAKIEPVDSSVHDGFKTEAEKELKSTQDALKDNKIIGPLVKLAATADQARIIMDLMSVVVEKEKSMRTTCIVTAARGRGKSAALGMAVAGAVQQGFANIFVTSPAPENLTAFFFFVVKGLEEMGYADKEDFEIHQSTNKEFNKAVVRINIFKEHRQTIQYISPQDSSFFAQAEMLVVDEAAAIPLPLVEKMFGPYLIFMASTVSGYEGTGRSLSVKLMQKLKAEAANTAGISEDVAKADSKNPRNISKSTAVGGGRQFKHFQLTEPIRYAPRDPVEKWLNTVLCMDTPLKSKQSLCPHPDQCELYYVNRDTLFSYHRVAEDLLQQMMSLYISSHYKNQPNDLQLMSDAPAHHLFVLLPPVDHSTTKMPEPICVIQACEEGAVSVTQMEAHMSEGKRSSGDLVPYAIAQNFQEPSFSKLSGVRIVRIAVSPDYQRMKYGSKALDLLLKYYNGKIMFEDEDAEEGGAFEGDDDAEEFSEGKEVLTKRAQLPHLLQPLAKRRLTENPDYICTSFGVTLPLFEFWQKSGFTPVYVRQAQNDLTGEHTMIMIKACDRNAAMRRDWLPKFQKDFQKRFYSLLNNSLRSMKIDLALSIALDTTQNPNPLMSNQKDVYAANTDAEGRRLVDGTPQLTAKDLDLMGMTVYDVKRLAAYAAHSVEIQVVYDLIPAIAQLYFTKRMVLTPDGNRGVALNISESAVLMGLGLQHKSIHDLATTELDLGTSQTSALIYKVLKSVSEYLQKVLGHAADAADDNMEGSSGAKKKKKLKKKSESEAFDGPPSKVAKTHG